MRMKKVPKRRRRQGKTDYVKRLNLLKSNSPRIIFRKTNRYVISQYVTSKEAQDKIVFGTSSKELIKHGWPKEMSGSLKSISASYLIGLLIGKKIIKEKLKTPIVDFGMHLVLHKSREFAFINGLVDAGLKIKTEKEAFPDEARIKGEHMKNKIPFTKIKENIEEIK
jgi:large subunit ribosomal protein L18